MAAYLQQALFLDQPVITQAVAEGDRVPLAVLAVELQQPVKRAAAQMVDRAIRQTVAPGQQIWAAAAGVRVVEVASAAQVALALLFCQFPQQVILVFIQALRQSRHLAPIQS